MFVLDAAFPGAMPLADDSQQFGLRIPAELVTRVTARGEWCHRLPHD
jgi:hypothetical protein